MGLDRNLMDRDYVQAHLMLQGYVPGMSAHAAGVWHPERGLTAAMIGMANDPMGMTINGPIKPNGWVEVEWDQIGHVVFWRMARILMRG